MTWRILFVALIPVWWSALAAGAGPTVKTGRLSYGIWAPELRELHLRIPLQATAGAGGDEFSPQGVVVDGQPARYAIWCFDGTPYDYLPIPAASRCRIEVFVPVAWRAGETHAVSLRWQYGGTRGTNDVVAKAGAGGAWAPAVGPGNFTFCVREEVGLARTRELVEFDTVVEQALFPDPARQVRATVVTGAGDHAPVPCQVYVVESQEGPVPLVRFRTAVLLSVPAHGEAMVALWNAPTTPVVRPATPIRMESAGNITVVDNGLYTIRLSRRSGQMLTWEDRPRGVRLEYVDPRKLAEDDRVINRTPDVYRAGRPWSHVFDWKPGEYQQAEIRGPVFVETTRWGPMPGAEELSGWVRYRFVAGRPEVAVHSALSALRAVTVLGLRNGGMSFTPSLFTHGAWPRPGGRIERLPLSRAHGNDTGAPPAARMPANTPWVAVYHAGRRYGIAALTTRLAYFTKGPEHPVTTGQKSYISDYRHLLLYTIRSVTQTYHANINSLPVQVPAGTELYEEMLLLPFSFRRENGRQFREVEDLDRRARQPLVVVP
ncbi:hypothetical protein HQ590_09395 [bacterium]|nr:hypothetical protein [bacterium]